MTNPTPANAPVGAGIILAIGVIGGTVIGAMNGQPSVGFLIGLGASAALAGLLWLKDRR